MTNATRQPGSPAQQTAHQANAMLFVTDLKSNLTLRSAWNKLLSAMKATVQHAKDCGESHDQIERTYNQAIQAADNFLADHGYNTTANDVLSLVKSPFYEEHLKETQPNADSDRFVQELLTSTKIYKAWQALVTQVAQGTAQSTQLDQFLKHHGFKCSYMQVNASFVKMRSHNMNYWSGSYPNTLITAPDGNSKKGPLMVVYGNYNLSIDNDKPDKHTNKLMYNNSVITWKADMLIKYDGKLTFSEITLPTKQDPYTGPVFSGQFTYAEDDPINGYKKGDVIQIVGRLDKMTQDDINHRLPPDEDPSLIDEILKWMNYVLVGFFIIKMLVSIGKKYTSFKEFESASDGAFNDKVANATERAEQGEKDIADIGESPFRQQDFMGSDMLKDLQLKIDEASGEEEKQLKEEYKEQEQAEEDYDNKPDEEADPEGDGWAADLEDAAADIL